MAVLFRLFSRYGVDNLEAIVINYFVCALVASVHHGRFIFETSHVQEPWFIFSIILGIIFILAFNITALSFQNAGLIITSVFQKMSLVIPTLLGIFYFSELATTSKISGIILALLAIALVGFNLQKPSIKLSLISLKYPMLLLLAGGAIESLLYFVQRQEIISGYNLNFTGSIFLIAGILGLPFIIYRNKKNYKKNLMAGLLLGIPNFYTIYFLLDLLNQGWEASRLFPMLNVSILALATLCGILLFSEKMSWNRIVGFTLTIFSIYLLS